MKRYFRPLLLFFITSMLCVFAPLTAEAGYGFGSRTETVSNGGTIVSVTGSYTMDKDKVLDLVNSYRYEACKNGYPDPRNTSRNLTLSDYVPIQWATHLEYIARFRAAELCFRYAHQRPNGLMCFSLAGFNGYSSTGEGIATNYGSDITGGLEQFYAEKSHWVNQQTNYETGHYESLINPNNRSMGYACFTCTTVEGRTGSEYAIEYSNENIEFDHVGYGDAVNVTTGIEINTSYWRLYGDPVYTIKDDNIEAEYGTSVGCHPGDSTKITMLFPSNGSLHVLLDNPNDVTTWSSSDTSVVTVTKSGKNCAIAKAVGIGRATVTMTANGKTLTLNFNSHHDQLVKIPAVSATCTEDGHTIGYKCSECGVVTVEPTVTSKLGHFPITLPGRAAGATVDGLTEGSKCSRCGTILVAQKVIPKYGIVALKNATIKLSYTKTAYTGKAKYPIVTVTYKGNTISSLDYYVWYSNNTKLGTGTVKIISKGGACTGSATKKFSIVLKTPSGITCSRSSTRTTIGWSKVKGAGGYYIYRNGKLYKTIKSGSTVKFTDKKIKSGTKYTYKIVAYAVKGSKTYKSSASKAIKV